MVPPETTAQHHENEKQESSGTEVNKQNRDSVCLSSASEAGSRAKALNPRDSASSCEKTIKETRESASIAPHAARSGSSASSSSSSRSSVLNQNVTNHRDNVVHDEDGREEEIRDVDTREVLRKRARMSSRSSQSYSSSKDLLASSHPIRHHGAGSNHMRKSILPGQESAQQFSSTPAASGYKSHNDHHSRGDARRGGDVGSDETISRQQDREKTAFQQERLTEQERVDFGDHGTSTSSCSRTDIRIQKQNDTKTTLKFSEQGDDRRPRRNEKRDSRGRGREDDRQKSLTSRTYAKRETRTHHSSTRGRTLTTDKGRADGCAASREDRVTMNRGSYRESCGRHRRQDKYNRKGAPAGRGDGNNRVRDRNNEIGLQQQNSLSDRENTKDKKHDVMGGGGNIPTTSSGPTMASSSSTGKNVIAHFENSGDVLINQDDVNAASSSDRGVSSGSALPSLEESHTNDNSSFLAPIEQPQRHTHTELEPGLQIFQSNVDSKNISATTSSTSVMTRQAHVIENDPALTAVDDHVRQNQYSAEMTNRAISSLLIISSSSSCASWSSQPMPYQEASSETAARQPLTTDPTRARPAHPNPPSSDFSVSPQQHRKQQGSFTVLCSPTTSNHVATAQEVDACAGVEQAECQQVPPQLQQRGSGSGANTHLYEVQDKGQNAGAQQNQRVDWHSFYAARVTGAATVSSSTFDTSATRIGNQGKIIDESSSGRNYRSASNDFQNAKPNNTSTSTSSASTTSSTHNRAPDASRGSVDHTSAGSTTRTHADSFPRTTSAGTKSLAGREATSHVPNRRGVLRLASPSPSPDREREDRWKKESTSSHHPRHRRDAPIASPRRHHHERSIRSSPPRSSPSGRDRERDGRKDRRRYAPASSPTGTRQPPPPNRARVMPDASPPRSSRTCNGSPDDVMQKKPPPPPPPPPSSVVFRSQVISKSARSQNGLPAITYANGIVGSVEKTDVPAVDLPMASGQSPSTSSSATTAAHHQENGDRTFLPLVPKSSTKNGRKGEEICHPPVGGDLPFRNGKSNGHGITHRKFVLEDAPLNNGKAKGSSYSSNEDSDFQHAASMNKTGKGKATDSSAMVGIGCVPPSLEAKRFDGLSAAAGGTSLPQPSFPTIGTESSTLGDEATFSARVLPPPPLASGAGGFSDSAAQPEEGMPFGVVPKTLSKFSSALPPTRTKSPAVSCSPSPRRNSPSATPIRNWNDRSRRSRGSTFSRRNNTTGGSGTKSSSSKNNYNQHGSSPMRNKGSPARAKNSKGSSACGKNGKGFPAAGKGKNSKGPPPGCKGEKGKGSTSSGKKGKNNRDYNTTFASCPRDSHPSMKDKWESSTSLRKTNLLEEPQNYFPPPFTKASAPAPSNCKPAASSSNSG
ncbi:unnamed protein product [Amoebophrya sp. A25]|nr:unnamed protein product [Amoebophrya sp. A25]|eukprot:GSA25T00018846001.1